MLAQHPSLNLPFQIIKTENMRLSNSFKIFSSPFFAHALGKCTTQKKATKNTDTMYDFLQNLEGTGVTACLP